MPATSALSPGEETGFKSRTFLPCLPLAAFPHVTQQNPIPVGQEVTRRRGRGQEGDARPPWPSAGPVQTRFPLTYPAGKEGLTGYHQRERSPKVTRPRRTPASPFPLGPFGVCFQPRSQTSDPPTPASAGLSGPN